MGRLVAGILAGFSGRVGPVSGSSWKGIGYMKTRPASVAISQSSGSVIARTKWAPLTKLGSILLAAIVKPLWDRFAQRESGYNAFVRQNYDAVNSSGALIPANIVISKGTLDGMEDFACVVDASDNVANITWTDNSGSGNAIATDRLFAAVYDVELEEWIQNGDACPRSAVEWGVLLNGEVVAGRHYFVYVAFRRADGSLVSNSQVLDKIAQA